MKMVSVESSIPLVIAGVVMLLWLIGLLSSRFLPKTGRVYSFSRRIPPFLVVLFTVFLLFAGASPYREIVIERDALHILVDLSESIDRTVVAREVDRLEEQLHGAQWEYEVTPFAGEVGVPAPSFSRISMGGGLERERTNISSALRRMVADRTSTSDIILYTDGVETDGDLREVVDELVRRGVTVYPQLPPDIRKKEERFFVQDLTLPLKRSAGETIQGSISFLSTKKRDLSGKLFLFRNGELLSDEELLLPAGSSITRALEISPSSLEQEEIEIRFVPSEGEAISRTWHVHADEGEQVLLLGSSSGETRYLRQSFEDLGVQVSEELSPEAGEGALGKYEAVIIHNLPERSLPALLRREMRSYVEAGGRFLLIGGDQSYGLGGYTGTAIDRLLPLASLTPRKEKKRVNVAVQLVLDKSASMRYGQKIEYSKQAAREVIRSLKDPDYFGVIGFDTTPFIAFPIRRLAEYRSMAIQRVGTLFAAGKTNLFPALDEARRGLVNTPAGRKHIIVMTDGKIPDEGPHYLQLVQQMRVRGITVSTVMMGTEADTELLRNMAQYGGGSFYRTKDPRSLPRIFLSDIEVSTKEETMKEQGEYPVRRSRSAARYSSDLTTFPPVRGFVETKARKDGYVELVVTAAGKAIPLFASRQVGKGETFSLATDASGRWSAPWVRWEKFRQFWQEVVLSRSPESDLARKSGDEAGSGTLDFDLRWFYQGGNLILDLILYEPAMGEVSLNVHSSQSSEPEEGRKFRPELIAPGRYQLRLPEPPFGDLTVSGNVGERSFGPLTLHTSGDELDELRPVGIQRVLLSQLAHQTGGAVNQLPPGLSSDEEESSGSQTVQQESLSWLFLLLALLTYALHIALRIIRPRDDFSLFPFEGT
ncbi:VWA domain-containing protein [bacterium]|nr:VWA domain-containing protein [bacterium]